MAFIFHLILPKTIQSNLTMPTQAKWASSEDGGKWEWKNILSKNNENKYICLLYEWLVVEKIIIESLERYKEVKNNWPTPTCRKRLKINLPLRTATCRAARFSRVCFPFSSMLFLVWHKNILRISNVREINNAWMNILPKHCTAMIGYTKQFA